MEPRDVVDQLNGYWLPIWQSTELPSAEQVLQFQRLVEDLPIAIAPIELRNDLDTWKEAVARVKGATARGFDGISGWELKAVPSDILQSLADLMTRCTQGMPSWFMKARVIPLSKIEGVPHAGQIRPITVLPLVYRLYAAVTCRQILWIWNQYFPESICGLLPSRGASDASYDSQMLLEKSANTAGHLSGITLDLRKCFNLMWRHIGEPLLEKLGVPGHAISLWTHSIQAMQRYWEVSGNCLGPYATERGYPEGDTHSVLIMLAVSLLWTLTLENGHQPLLQARAYADNWSWTVLQPEEHVHAARNTLHITALCGLEVDWDKTWSYANTTDACEKAQSYLAQVIPLEQVKRVHHARDLGLELRYSGQHRLGQRADRYDNAFARLKRLTFVKTSSVNKEILWLTSIFPACFHGAELCPPAKALVQKVRSAAANAIYGQSQYMSPAIALLLGTRHILDPGFQLIIQAIRAARRWLKKKTDRHRLEFYSMAAQFRGGITKVRGPASALGLYFSDIGWSLTRSGEILATPFRKLHLLNDSFTRLKTELELAWQEDFYITHTERKHLYGLPNPSRCETVQLLNQLEDEARGTVVREIAGAFQVQEQKQKWLDTTLQCPFCSQDDSRYHRLHECAAFADIRSPYQDDLDWFEREGICVAELPLVSQHEDQAAHRLMQFQEPRAEVGDEFFHLAWDRKQDKIPLYMYTDGSCRNPAAAATRAAGFAVVVDLCIDDMQRRQFANEYLVTNEFPCSLQPLAMSRVACEQTVPRAELLAIEVTTRFDAEVHTYSDSQYALDTLQKIRDGRYNTLYGKDCDVAACIQNQLRHSHHFHKIKAHQNPREVTNLLELYHVLGNAVADRCARESVDPAASAFSHSLEQRHLFQQQVRERLLHIYQFLVELHKARKLMEMSNNQLRIQQDIHEVHTTEELAFHTLQQFTLQDGEQFDTEDIATSISEFFPWGKNLTFLFQRWYDTLRWPKSERVPKSCKAGITWLELAFAFSWYVGSALPATRNNDEGQRRLLMVGTKNDSATYNLTLYDYSYCLQAMWAHYTYCLADSQQPHAKRGKNGSLLYLGYQNHAYGLSTRPVYPGQTEVIPFLAKTVSGKDNYDVQVVPHWLTDHRTWSFTEVDWEPLKQKAYIQRRNLRKKLGL